MGINYAPIINRTNELSENVLLSKNGKIVTEIYLKSFGTNKIRKKSNTYGLVKKIKRTISSNAII